MKVKHLGCTLQCPVNLQLGALRPALQTTAAAASVKSEELQPGRLFASCTFAHSRI